MFHVWLCQCARDGQGPLVLRASSPETVNALLVLDLLTNSSWRSSVAFFFTRARSLCKMQTECEIVRFLKIPGLASQGA